MNEVLVLHAALSGVASVQAVTRLLEALPYGYRLAIGRRDEDARLASLAGIALLLEAVRWTRGEPPIFGVCARRRAENRCSRAVHRSASRTPRRGWRSR